MTTELQPASFYIEIPGIGYYYSATITASNEKKVELPESAVVSSSDDQDKGIYLVISSDKVTVIGRSNSSETFLAFSISHKCFPNYAYYLMSLGNRTLGVAYYINSVLIVGTEDSTMMRLTVTQPATIKVDDTDTDLTPGRQFSFMINRLQTVYVGSVENLTEIKINTNKPVSVFSEFQKNFNIYFTQQVPPTTSWGRVYYTTPVSFTQSNTIQVLAAYNSTNVDIYCNDIRRPLHAISEGEVNYVIINPQEYCAIHSNKEILVVQFREVSPFFLVFVPSTDYFSHKFLFLFENVHSVINFNYSSVNIIVLAQYYQPDMIYLISGGVNKSLDTQEWVPVKVNNVTKAYGTIVTTQESVAEIIHTNPSALMTTTVYNRYGDSRGFKHYKGMHFVFSTRHE